MLGDLISGGMKFLGGILDRNAAKDVNEQQQANVAAQMQNQRDFAQNAIQWKVNDAKLAGVHPLFALGASTSSYAPVSLGLEKASMGPALAEMGQDVSRAMSANSNKATREAMAGVNVLQMEGMKLDNDIKRAKLASDLKKLAEPAVPPGLPVPEASKFEDRPKLAVDGTVLGTDSGTTNAEDFEKRYGELSDWIFGPQVLYNDIMGRTEPFMSEVQWNKLKKFIGGMFGITR